jgi:hypothetical protein
VYVLAGKGSFEGMPCRGEGEESARAERSSGLKKTPATSVHLGPIKEIAMALIELQKHLEDQLRGSITGAGAIVSGAFP